MEVSSADALERAFKEVTKSRSAALAVTQSPLFGQKIVADLAAKYRLPAIFGQPGVDAGSLLAYGSDRAEPYRRVAVMIDKILKGTKPADIPVERSTKFEFVINLKAAKQIGLTIPPEILARANRIIR